MATARALRKDVFLKLGMIMVPVNVLSKIREDKDATFNTICAGNGAGLHPPVKIQTDYKCPSCGETDKTTFQKGKVVGSSVVIVPQEEIDAAGAPDDQKNSLTFTAHPRTEVMSSTAAAGKVYYLEPTNPASKEPYAVISRMVAEMPELAFCTMFAVRSLAAPYVLASSPEGVLTIEQLAFPELVNTPPVVQDPTSIDIQYLDVMRPFVATITAPFTPDTFIDTRKETLAAFVATQEAIASGATPPPATPRAAAPAVPSLLDMLKASLPAETPAKPKRAPAKKAPAKAGA